MKKTLALLLCILFTISLTGCHKHVPGPEATCTEPQICPDCGKVLREALGHEAAEEPTCAHDQVCIRCGEVLAEALPHTPGEEPTCTRSQSCTVCGAVLVQAMGHTVGDDGVCTVCAEQVCEPGQKYTRPGKGDYASDDAAALVKETENAGHYQQQGDSYYANAVLICGDYGMEYFSPGSSGSDGWAGIVNDFAEKYPQLHVTALLTPKCCAYESPADRENVHDATAQFISATYAMLRSGIRTADTVSEMDAHAGEYMFYRTDHHWTSLGAYYASRAYCLANDIEPLALESYETTVRTGVTGTLYMYSGNDGALLQNPDYTVCHYPQTGYTMRCYNGGWYNAVAVNGSYRDYAGVFINGDNPLTVIKTDNHNGKTLMLFKESYGNAFAPYMIDYYEQVIVVDLRQSGNMPATSELISTYGVTDVLFINNVQAATSLQDSLRTTALS